MRKGLYKQYISREYNDANVKEQSILLAILRTIPRLSGRLRILSESFHTTIMFWSLFAKRLNSYEVGVTPECYCPL